MPDDRRRTRGHGSTTPTNGCSARSPGFRLRSGAPCRRTGSRPSSASAAPRCARRFSASRRRGSSSAPTARASRCRSSPIAEVNDACDLLEVLDTYICRKAASKLDGRRHRSACSANVAEMTARGGGGRPRLAGRRPTSPSTALVNAIAGNQLVAETVKETRRRDPAILDARCLAAVTPRGLLERAPGARRTRWSRRTTTPSSRPSKSTSATCVTACSRCWRAAAAILGD